MKQLALLVILSFIFFNGMSQSEPSKASAFINEGIKLHDQKKYDEAIAIYKANLTISLSDVASLIPGLSENEKLGQQLKSIFSIVGELAEKKASKDFFWSYYADYFGKIGKSEYMPMVAHIIGFTANQEENRKWITANDTQLQDFNKWRIEIPRKVSM